MRPFKVFTTHIILLSLFLISGNTSYAQISQGGSPRSHSPSLLKSTVAIPSFATKAIDTEKLLEEDLQSPTPTRFSIFEDVIINIKQEGIEIDLPEEQGHIWLYSIDSKDALSIQLQFKNFLLPEGGELFIYNKDHSIVRGAFTSYNNNSKNQLMMADIIGNHVTIEYFEPYNTSFEGFIELGAIGLGYKDYMDLKTFEDPDGYINVNTPEGEDWQNEKHSVCKITFRKGTSGYLCTGGLLNNSRSDGTPYFLTADHCIDDPDVAETVVALFNYEIYGGSGEVRDGLTLSGVTQLLVNSSTTDFSLLLLGEVPDADYQPFYAAWDATNQQESTTVGIHHPHGFPKRMSIDDSVPVSYDYEINWEGGSVTSPNTHWAVSFDHGETSGGSSGSPLFNSDKQQVIGQLHGGSENDYYGKFNESFLINTPNDMRSYLDPDGMGLLELEEGYYPSGNLPDPQIFPEFQYVCLGTPVQFTGMSAFDPISWSWSFSPGSITYTNGTDASSKEPMVQFDSDGPYGVSLTVTNSAGSKTKSFPGTVMVGNSLTVQIQPFAIEDSCLFNFDSLRLVAIGAQDYLWLFDNEEEEHFYFVDDTMNPVTIKMKKAPTGSVDLSVKLIGSHGTCSEEITYVLPFSQQSNDSIKNAIELFEGESALFTNLCASIEDNEPIPPITSCTGNSWCDEFGTGEDIIANSVWFYFIPEETSEYKIESFGMDNQIAVYSAESAEALLEGSYELIGANDDFTLKNANPRVNVDLLEGEKYLIQSDGSAGNVTGNFSFTIALVEEVSARSAKLEQYIKVYPQPVNDALIVECGGFINSDHILADIFDISGAQIHSIRYENTQSKSIEINTSQWGNGVYFIRFRVDQAVYTKRVVKF